MSDTTLHQAGKSGATRGAAEGSRGISFPRLYDLLLRIMTRGRDPGWLGVRDDLRHYLVRAA